MTQSLCTAGTASALEAAQVAKSVDVSHVTPLLAQLGAYDGLVTLALAKAAALDPEQVAAQASDAGRAAREVRSTAVPACLACCRLCCCSEHRTRLC